MPAVTPTYPATYFVSFTRTPITIPVRPQRFRPQRFCEALLRSYHFPYDACDTTKVTDPHANSPPTHTFQRIFDTTQTILLCILMQ